MIIIKKTRVILKTMNRLFLALSVTLFDYQNLQDDFEHIIQGKWIPVQNLHLTLKFFAGQFEKEFLIERLSELNLQVEPSCLKGLELFEDGLVLYAKTQNPSILALHREVEKALMLSSAQEFTPHVTLMRIKKIHHRTLFEKRLRLYNEKLLGKVEPKIELIQSTLTPEGAKYTSIKVFSN